MGNKTNEMKTKIQFWVIVLILLGVVFLQIEIYRQGLSASKLGKVDEKKTLDAISVDYVPRDRFDRGNLILKVSKGDKDAAFELATHYARERLPEAAFYWFGVSIKLGHKGMSKESLEFYEYSIIGEFEK